MGRSRQRGKRQNAQDQDDNENGYLYIGGVKMQIDDQGNIRNLSSSRANVNRRQQKQKQQQPRKKEKFPDIDEGNSTHSSEGPDSDVKDYLANTAAANSSSDDDEEHNSSIDKEQQALKELEMLQRFTGVEIGQQTPVEDIGWMSSDPSSSDSSASEEDDEWSSSGEEEGNESDEELIANNNDNNDDGDEVRESDSDVELSIQHFRGLGKEEHPTSAAAADALLPALQTMTVEEVDKALGDIEMYMLSEEYKQMILATADQEARLDVANTDPEVYLMKKKKGKARKKKLGGMEGLDAVTLTAIYECRASEKRKAARATRDKYLHLKNQADTLGMDPRSSDTIVPIQRVIDLLEKHADRVEQWPVLLSASQKATTHNNANLLKKGSRHKPGVKGAKGGKLAPGEKAALRKQHIKEKRAGRAAARGFDLASCNIQLLNFVDTGQDLMAFPAMGKHECRVLQKLAALYGCKATAQGSGKKRMVMVAATNRTETPDEEVLIEIGRMLAQHNAAEIYGEAEMEKRQGRKDSAGKGGRWAGLRQETRQYSVHAEAVVSKRMRYKQPVAFVSKGAMDPNQSGGVEIILRHPNVSPEEEESREKEDMDVEVDINDNNNSDDDNDYIIVDTTQQQQQQQQQPSAPVEQPQPTASFIQVLEVFEDRTGAALPANNEVAVDDDDQEVVVPVLLAPPSKASPPLLPRFGAGIDHASEGITNAGRLLGLGMALGVGSQVFQPQSGGGLGISSRDAVVGDDGDGIADLSPLQRKLSKSEMKRQGRRRAGGATAASPAVAPPSYEVQGRLDSTVTSKGGGKKSKKGGKLNKPQQQPIDTRFQAPFTSFEDEEDVHRGGIGNSGLRQDWGVNGEFASFEQHTTGIGSKLLSKWGFGGEGSGLGKGGSGRAEPIVARRRSKGLGLGADGL